MSETTHTPFGERIRAEYAALLATAPRDMPKDFGLNLTQETRDGTTVTIWPGENGIGPLSFAHTEEIKQNGVAQYDRALRESAWYALELKRLGRFDSLKASGVLS